MNEREVIHKVRHALHRCSIVGQRILRLYTDAHSTLLGDKALAPFQRFTLDFGNFAMHPDLVGQIDDGETVLAVEAKGDSDLLRGLAQAEMYQAGFHLSFLAAAAGALGTNLVEVAKRKNLGVIAVGDEAELVHVPVAGVPLRDLYRAVERQLDTVVQVSPAQTFHYNLPTHYLVWAIGLEPHMVYEAATLPRLLAGYPLPKEWQSALRGARRLGLVQTLGTQVRLTPVGAAVKELLPPSLPAWAEVHQMVSARGNSPPLADYRPAYAAVLRLLLLADPLVRLLIAGLESTSLRSVPFDTLAALCDQIDHARAPILFLKPEAQARLMDSRGRIAWTSARGEDFRSTTFFQLKSVLKHAGILAATRLGGSTVRGYDPKRDSWTLR